MHAKRYFALAAVLVSSASGLQAAPPRPAVLQPFPLTQVQLGDGVLKKESLADQAYLRALDSDRLLYNFRKTAGLPAPGQPLGGWEDPTCELRGHFVGHYLSACALMYQSSGDTVLKDKATAMVAEMAKCQDALGTGYLSAFPSEEIDRVEAVKPVWAPYYTIHKIMAGLVDVYTYCGDKQALTVAEKMADYFRKRSDKLSDAQFQAMLIGNEFGGMANVLWDMYAIDKRPGDKSLAERFEKKPFLEPLERDVDDLSGIHANTHIPQVLGAARRYELAGDQDYGHLSSFFWDAVVDHHSYATGGSNAHEHWGDPDKLAHTLVKGGQENQETCTTYNMLKLTRDLIQWTGDPKYADYYQHAFWNGIVEAQNPTSGMMIYYTSLAANAKKHWGTPNNDFWCCYGTGVESFAKLDDSIYFHDDKNLYVHLYAASTVHWREKGLDVEQTTNFPEEQGSKFVIHTQKPVRAGLRLLIPSWTSNAQISVNGKKISTPAKSGAYAALDQIWKNGDTIAISLPFTLRATPMPDDPDVQAVSYGPVVLAGVSETSIPSAPYDATYGLLHVSSANPATWLKPVPGKPLTFTTVGQKQETTFVPLYRVVDQIYTVYWAVDKPGSSVAAKTADFQRQEAADRANTYDWVQPADDASEQAHHLASERSGSGFVNGHGWRDASGWFQWDFQAPPADAPATLRVSYWGSDAGRTFDILVNGHPIATQTLTAPKPDSVYSIDYALPEDVLKGADKITVRFQAHEGGIAGGVFGCKIVKTGAPAI